MEFFLEILFWILLELNPYITFGIIILLGLIGLIYSIKKFGFKTFERKVTKCKIII